MVKQKQTFPELWTCSGCPLARNYISCFLHLANCYPSFKTQLKCCLLCEALSSLISSWFLSLAPRFQEYFAFPSFKVNLGSWAPPLSWEGSKPTLLFQHPQKEPGAHQVLPSCLVDELRRQECIFCGRWNCCPSYSLLIEPSSHDRG